MKEETKPIQDLNRLIEIVADEFRVEPEGIKTQIKGGTYKLPRHVVAAIYSNWETLARTAELLNFKSHQSVYYSRRRVQTLINEGRYKKQLLAVMDRVAEELPLMLP